MTSYSESRRESTEIAEITVLFLTRIQSWIVSMRSQKHQTGRREQVAAEMNKYSGALLRISSRQDDTGRSVKATLSYEWWGLLRRSTGGQFTSRCRWCRAVVYSPMPEDTGLYTYLWLLCTAYCLLEPGPLTRELPVLVRRHSSEGGGFSTIGRSADHTLVLSDLKEGRPSRTQHHKTEPGKIDPPRCVLPQDHLLPITFCLCRPQSYPQTPPAC